MTPPRFLTAETRLQQQLPPISVFINSIEQKYVTAYDCDTGTVERIETSALDGSPVRCRDEFSIETVQGDVTVQYG